MQKNTVWEESTRVPFMVRLPAGTYQAGAICNTPVSLIDLYPTLIDLCNLPEHPNAKGNDQPLDGHSIAPLLQDPAAGIWDGPPAALTSVAGISEVADGDVPPVEEQHYSVRSRHFRYIRWADGFEEFYDHRVDPHEWTNSLRDPGLQNELKIHREYLDLML